MILNDGERSYRTLILREPVSIPPTRYKILELLGEAPRTLTELAEILETTEQNVFYHLKNLEKIGVVRKIYGERKLYTLEYDAIATVFGKGKPARAAGTPGAIERFFKEFTDGDKLTAPIVVGSPDPHGAFMQRARDGHYAGALGMFLGRFYTVDSFPMLLDTDARAEQRIGDSLILIGGPAGNMVSWEILGERKLFFDTESPWLLHARRDYAEDSVGVVAKFKNPYSDRWILLFAGVRALGTKAAIMALIQQWEELLTKYRDEKEFYWVVQGFDADADGHIDRVELREYGEITERLKLK